MSEIKIIKSFLNEETEIQTSSEASWKPRKMRVCVGVLKITWFSKCGLRISGRPQHPFLEAVRSSFSQHVCLGEAEFFFIYVDQKNLSQQINVRNREHSCLHLRQMEGIYKKAK